MTNIKPVCKLTPHRGSNEMPDELKMDNKPKYELVNIEKTLPKLIEKVATNESIQTELTTRAQRLPELKKEFADAEKRYDALKKEIAQTNKRVVELNRKFEPPYANVCNRIQQSWKASPIVFLVRVIAIAMFVSVIVFAVFQNTNAEILAVEIGIIIMLLLLMKKSPKHRQLMGNFIFAVILLILSNYTSNDLKWILISIALAIIAIALAWQSFVSDATVEIQLKEIDGKISKLLNTPNQLPTEVAKKPEDKK